MRPSDRSVIWIQVPRSLLYRRLTSSTRAAYPRSAVEANAVSTRRGIGVFVLAAAITGWNCGNVGPVVGQLTKEFDIGLGEVGLLSGAFFFAGSAVGSLVGDTRKEDPGASGDLGMLRALHRGH